MCNHLLALQWQSLSQNSFFLQRNKGHQIAFVGQVDESFVLTLQVPCSFQGLPVFHVQSSLHQQQYWNPRVSYPPRDCPWIADGSQFLRLLSVFLSRCIHCSCMSCTSPMYHFVWHINIVCWEMKNKETFFPINYYHYLDLRVSLRLVNSS